MDKDEVVDTIESTSAPSFAWKPGEPLPFRMSASYTSRYNNCHGSANLEEAIPGFVHPDRNERGMKGEGTILHKIFQDVILSGVELTEAASLLELLAGMRGPKRTELVLDEKKYIMWWFFQFKTAPPVEHAIIRPLHYVTTGIANGREVVTEWNVAPRRIVFLAEALRYVFDTIDTMEGAEVHSEIKQKAEWLTTRPSTTADLVLRDKNELHVMDLKMGDVPVSTIDNEQLMYYAKTWGAEKYDKVVVHILQRNNMDYWEVPRDTLQQWVKKVQQSEAEILDGDLSLSFGGHCTFCPANPHSRGDRGSKNCPVAMRFLYGERDATQADNDVLEGDFDD